VADILGAGVGVSVGLGLAALAFSSAVGITVGVWAATRASSFGDHAAMAAMLVLFSIPSFVLIAILRWLNFQLYQRGLPSLPVAGWGRPEHWIMPVFVLAASSMGYIARLTRLSLLEVHRQDYIRTARAKGLAKGASSGFMPCVMRRCPSSRFWVRRWHSSSPALSAENLFLIPGIGFLSVQAIQQRDYPVIQSTTVILALAVVFMNLLTDLLYLLLDPRVRIAG
jgi:ABC-type dipeptide/oligopeptide/nickel transport system permease component